MTKITFHSLLPNAPVTAPPRKKTEHRHAICTKPKLAKRPKTNSGAVIELDAGADTVRAPR